MGEIQASIDTLFRQASMTADTYLIEAIDRIDSHLGQGYAAAHPALIGAFMQTAALDLVGAILGKKLEELSEALIEGRQTDD